MKKRLLVGLLTFVMALSVMAPGLTTQAQGVVITDEFGLKTRSQSDIKDYFKSHGIDRETLLSKSVTMNEEPNLSAPYTPVGRISDESRRDALNLINAIRYVAGLEEVTIDPQMELTAQYGTALLAARQLNGDSVDILTHTPETTSGITDEFYNRGYEGCNKTNLYWNSGTTVSLWKAIVHGWLGDSDDSNIDRVGHRRWLLGSALKKTGIGVTMAPGAGSFCSMYVVSGSRSEVTEQNVMWPAKNTPVEFMEDGMAWSVTLGDGVTISNPRVTVKALHSGRSWDLSPVTNSGDFYVSESSVGYQGPSIIFRPAGIDGYKPGDSYEVTVEGVSTGTISYTVDFFSAQPEKVLRFYNPITGEHYYTTDKSEVAGLELNGWMSEMSPGISAGSDNGSPVYRLKNSETGECLYTSDKREAKNLTENEGWKYENNGKPIFYSNKNGSKKMYRLFNPSAPILICHHYTSDTREIRDLLSRGWVYDFDGKPVFTLE